MSYPRFVRPDLCSIRTADEQDELAEAVRNGFSAAGYPRGDDDPPVPLRSGIDRAIRLSTAAAVLAVAGIAAYVSYGHAYAVVRAHGESAITARLEPATIDGLVYASSTVVLYAPGSVTTAAAPWPYHAGTGDPVYANPVAGPPRTQGTGEPNLPTFSFRERPRCTPGTLCWGRRCMRLHRRLGPMVRQDYLTAGSRGVGEWLLRAVPMRRQSPCSWASPWCSRS
jgi:hypothetical protein